MKQMDLIGQPTLEQKFSVLSARADYCSEWPHSVGRLNIPIVVEDECTAQACEDLPDPTTPTSSPVELHRRNPLSLLYVEAPDLLQQHSLLVFQSAPEGINVSH